MQPRRILALASPSIIKHMRGIGVLTVGLGAAAAAGAAQADEESSWGLGIAAFSAQQSYIGAGRETKALPLISYENQYVRVFGPVAEFKAYSADLGGGQRLGLSVIGKYDFSGYKAGDAPILNGMRERKDSFWAGGKVTWRTGVADVSAELLADVSGKSKGRRANLSLEKTWHVGDFLLTPRVGAAWVDKKYVNYYYGVATDEARAGRAAYQGSSGVNAELGLRSIYVIDAHHSLFLDLRATRLAKKIKDSPLADRSTVNRVGLGYLYGF